MKAIISCSLVFVLICLTAVSADAQQPSTAPAASPRPSPSATSRQSVTITTTIAATTMPASMPSDPHVQELLRQLEEAGVRDATIQADIVYHVDMKQTGDTEDRSGWVAYQKGPIRQGTKQVPNSLRHAQAGRRPQDQG